MKINIEFDDIYRDAKGFAPIKSNSYLVSYPEFIEYFRKIIASEFTEHHLIIASHFTYGWMPKILNLNLENKTEIIQYLSAVLERDKNTYGVKEFEKLKKAINNSVVGLSKLLHFMNPEIYPIWDSNIYRYLTSEKSYHYRVNSVTNYLRYIEFVNTIVNHKDFYKVQSIVNDRLGYKVTAIRATEVVMFETAKKKNSKKNIW